MHSRPPKTDLRKRRAKQNLCFQVHFKGKKVSQRIGHDEKKMWKSHFIRRFKINLRFHFTHHFQQNMRKSIFSINLQKEHFMLLLLPLPCGPVALYAFYRYGIIKDEYLCIMLNRYRYYRLNHCTNTCMRFE